MRRLMLYDRLGNSLGELSENDVFEAVLREEINGEHSLTITTTQVLEKGIRLLYQDGRGKWREFAVAGVDAEHASGDRVIGTYYCVWSVQEDLQGVTVSVMPGVRNPVAAGTALTSLLSSQSRWGRGTVTNTATGGASMYDRSAWEALSVLVEVWGGEVDATITIGTQSGVTGRAVDLYAKQGNQTALRRFDFAHDLQSVKRTLPDTPFYCRISPRGAGEETDAGGHGRKITIESVNSGKDYLEYSPMVDAAKLPNGSGYIYPTLIVENSDCKTPTDLKTWAQSVLAEYCVPKVTYEIDVLQAGVEGVDFTGVSLGDAVQVVDRKFSHEGIRIEGRVRSITTDLLNEHDISIVIGDAVESVSSKFAKVDKSLSTIGNDITVMSTAEYINNLLDRINAEINATGGYTYITEGQGIRTYDVAVSDPLVGAEASKVVEIKGGSIRIADSKTAQGEWEWRSVFTSGHIAADMVTTANITAGYIGSADSGNYWNLDTGAFRLTSAATVGGEPIVTGLKIDYAQNTSRTTSPDPENDSLWSTSVPAWQEGHYIWQRVTSKSGGTPTRQVACISGADGNTGTNAAGVYLYARAAGWSVDGTALKAANPGALSVSGTTAKISGEVSGTTLTLGEAPVKDMAETLTYTFATGKLTGSLGSWSQSVPEGDTACYVTMATAISNGGTDTINISEWSEPIALSTAGIDGLNSATVYLYRRQRTWSEHGSTIVAPTPTAFSVSGTTATMPGTVEGTTLTIAPETPAKPSVDTVYTFATGELDPLPSGWYREIPEGDEAIWVIAASAISNGATDSIAASEWSDVVLMSEPGIGVEEQVEEWYRSTSNTSLSGGSWSSGQPTPRKGTWLWSRLRTTWTDGAITYTDPQLANAVNAAFENSLTAAEQVVTLDQSLDMDGVMWRLTNGYQWQGIYYDDETGDYYINASMIMAGYINASLIKTGILMDATGTNYWNMLTGDVSMAALPKNATVNLYARVPTWTVRGTELKAPSVSAMSVSGTTATISGATVSGTTLSLGNAPQKPQTSTTYDFSDGSLSPIPSGWSRTIPQDEGAIWVTTAYVTSSGMSASIAPGDWSEPAFMTDTTSGLNGTSQQWYLSTSESTPTGGSWSDGQPAVTDGTYLWSRFALSWEDGSTTYTEPVLANAINSAYRAVYDLDWSMNQQEIFKRLTGAESPADQTKGLYLQNGELFVNATLIQSGILQVLDTNRNVIFKADMGTKDVKLGGFTANATALYSGSAVTSNADNAIALSTADFTRTLSGTSRSGLRFAVGDKYGMTGDGTAYLAGFVIDSTSIYSGTKTGNASGNVYLGTANSGTRAINGVSSNSWRLAIGSKFGVMADGTLYASGAKITNVAADSLTVPDSSGNTLFNASKSSKAVQLAGFTAKNGALYNGLASSSGFDQGVYLGTDGVATANGYERLSISGGAITGYQSGQGKVMTFDPNAQVTERDGGTVVATHYGARLVGGIFEIRVPKLAVLASDSTSAASTITYTGSLSYVDGLSSSTNGNTITITPSVRTETLVHGMTTNRATSTGTSISVASANHTHSGYASSSHSHDTATTSANGFMSSSDKSKLNGIASQASKVSLNGTRKNAVNFALDGTELTISFT